MPTYVELALMFSNFAILNFRVERFSGLKTNQNKGFRQKVLVEFNDFKHQRSAKGIPKFMEL